MNRRFRIRFDIASTDSEYRANMLGLNTFFGAVLGFVVTGFESLAIQPYVMLLILCSAIVMCILYVSNSPNRWPYVALGALLIAALPRLLPEGASLPPKLQPTFAVWMALTLFLELAPRKADAQPADTKPPT